MIISGSGTSWTAIKAPVPPGTAELADPGGAGIACYLPSDCVATGAYIDKSDVHHGLLLIESGKSWAATLAPLPANAATYSGALGQMVSLGDIECPSSSVCVAAGSYTDLAGDSQGLLVTRVRGRWIALQAPAPPGVDASGGTALDSVACPSASMCVITGSYTDSDGHAHAMLVTGSQDTWSAVKVPPPPGAEAADQSNVGAIACPSAVACVATGSYTDGQGHEHWILVNGSREVWAAHEIQMPPAKTVMATDPPGGLDSVACISLDECAAVGSYSDSSRNEHPILINP